MIRLTTVALSMLAIAPAGAQTSDESLYRFETDGRPRWASPENREAKKGAGGVANKGAKGRAFETIAAHDSLVLADIQGAGIIDRMWLTIDDRSPEMLRGLRIDIYWDGAAQPAVSSPLGDLFGGGAGELTAMDSALIASPEGRSFLSYIPMPFRKGARVVVTNDTGKRINLIFWDVNYRSMSHVADDALYFHAYWSRERRTGIGQDFRILPRVTGRGRFLGSIVTVSTDPRYGDTWWGEGEVKIYLDGDRDLPTLVGTGSEDYIGSAWQQGIYANRFQGSLVADAKHGRWTFYRFHLPDPIFFDRDVQVDLQQIGGAPKERVVAMQRAGVPLKPVTVDRGRLDFHSLLASGKSLDDHSLPDGGTNFYRSDDVSAVALFYLDKPTNGLPPLEGLSARTTGLRGPLVK